MGSVRYASRAILTDLANLLFFGHDRTKTLAIWKTWRPTRPFEIVLSISQGSQYKTSAQNKSLATLPNLLHDRSVSLSNIVKSAPPSDHHSDQA